MKIIAALLTLALCSCSAYERTVAARQIGVSGKYDGHDAKGFVTYRVEYR